MVLGRGRFANLTVGSARLDLQAADLRKADLARANLERAILRDTHLEESNLRGAHLKGSGLTYALLNKANLTDVRLKGSVIRRTARWPDGFDWRAAGVVLVDQFGKPVVEPDGTSAGAEADMPAPAVSDSPAAGLP